MPLGCRFPGRATVPCSQCGCEQRAHLPSKVLPATPYLPKSKEARKTMCSSVANRHRYACTGPAPSATSTGEKSHEARSCLRRSRSCMVARSCASALSNSSRRLPHDAWPAAHTDLAKARRHGTPHQTRPCVLESYRLGDRWHVRHTMSLEQRWQQQQQRRC
jgi:hypothetical protein